MDITQPCSVVLRDALPIFLCHGGDSIVTVSATGGTGAYSGTGTFSVPAGTYSYTVTDANSCTSTTTEIGRPHSSTVATSVNTVLLCAGGDKIETVSATGGT